MKHLTLDEIKTRFPNTWELRQIIMDRGGYFDLDIIDYGNERIKVEFFVETKEGVTDDHLIEVLKNLLRFEGFSVVTSHEDDLSIFGLSKKAP